MEELTLPAQLRSSIGKGEAKKLRAQGFLPAILYGGKETTATSLSVSDHDVRAIIKQHGGMNTLINLLVESKGKPSKHLTLIQEIQKHPYKDIIWHLDFIGVSLDKMVTVEVPLTFQGEITGKATMETHFRSIEIECLPDQIPNEIIIDISKLSTGASLTIKDLPLPPNVKVLGNMDRVVAAVVEIVAEEEIKVEEETTGTEEEADTESSQE